MKPETKANTIAKICEYIYLKKNEFDLWEHVKE